MRAHPVFADMPVTVFVSDKAGGSVIRLCFAKADAVLDEAVGRLGRAAEALRGS